MTADNILAKAWHITSVVQPKSRSRTCAMSNRWPPVSRPDLLFQSPALRTSLGSVSDAHVSADPFQRVYSIEKLASR